MSRSKKTKRKTRIRERLTIIAGGRMDMRRRLCCNCAYNGTTICIDCVDLNKHSFDDTTRLEIENSELKAKVERLKVENKFLLEQFQKIKPEPEAIICTST